MKIVIKEELEKWIDMKCWEKDKIQSNERIKHMIWCSKLSLTIVYK